MKSTKSYRDCDRFGDSKSECCFLKLGLVALRQGPAPSRVPSLQEPEMRRVTMNDGKLLPASVPQSWEGVKKKEVAGGRI